MRDLRLKRKNFERVFMEQLFVAFANLGQARCSGAHLVPLVSYEAVPGTSADDVEKPWPWRRCSVGCDTVMAWRWGN